MVFNHVRECVERWVNECYYYNVLYRLVARRVTAQAGISASPFTLGTVSLLQILQTNECCTYYKGIPITIAELRVKNPYSLPLGEHL